jgi:hypothetical protein
MRAVAGGFCVGRLESPTARSAMMRSMSTDDDYNRFQWLYGGSGLADGTTAIR